MNKNASDVVMFFTLHNISNLYFLFMRQVCKY